MLTSCTRPVDGILWIVGVDAQYCSQAPWWYDRTANIFHLEADFEKDECIFSCYRLVDVRRRTEYSEGCRRLCHPLQCFLWI